MLEDLTKIMPWTELHDIANELSSREGEITATELRAVLAWVCYEIDTVQDRLIDLADTVSDIGAR